MLVPRLLKIQDQEMLYTRNQKLLASGNCVEGGRNVTWNQKLLTSGKCLIIWNCTGGGNVTWNQKLLTVPTFQFSGI